jgi:hypothetical protein
MPESISPWGLTETEVRAINAMIEHGQMKVAAHRLGVPYFTFIDQLVRARKKIKAENTIQAYILWNHWYTQHGNKP